MKGSVNVDVSVAALCKPNGIEVRNFVDEFNNDSRLGFRVYGIRNYECHSMVLEQIFADHAKISKISLALELSSTT